jgi:DNA polymerase-3 subunit gamma/tau
VRRAEGAKRALTNSAADSSLMSYQVIARKYRPQRFEEVVGQEHVTLTLANAVRQQRIAHAYLFCGPRGTGKTTIARIFAKCLNCANGPRVDFDDGDPKCREIAEGRSMDVFEIDGASNRGIEEIRELRETVKYVPASSRYKVYIIDEVHMLTKEAFNALLKTLEEPPSHVKFLFATTEPEKVLPTILSRCQRFDLRRIPSTLIVKHLAQVAAAENVQIEPAALDAIARGADGGMRDAESTLDQLISFCAGAIVEADVLSMFGLAARSQVLRLGRAILAGAPDQALRELDALARGGKDLGRLLSELLSFLRNLLVFQVGRGDLSMLDVSEAEAEALRQHAAAVETATLVRMLHILTDGETRLREATSRKILIELTVIQASQARHAASVDQVLGVLRTLREQSPPADNAERSRPRPAAAREGTPSAASATEAPAPSPAAVSAPAATAEPAVELPPAAAATTAPPTAAPPAVEEGRTLDALWADVIEAVGRVSQFTRSYLIEAHPVSFTKGVLTIGFDPEFADQLSLVDNTKNRTLLQTKLQELGHPGAVVKFLQAPSPLPRRRPASDSGAAAAAPAASPAGSAEPRNARATPGEPGPASQEDFRNDPLIRQAIEVFKGTILEVHR